jgi:hypothetical protein
MIAISGGESLSDLAFAFVIQSVQVSLPGAAPTGWTATGATVGNLAATMTGYAICINAGCEAARELSVFEAGVARLTAWAPFGMMPATVVPFARGRRWPTIELPSASRSCARSWWVPVLRRSTLPV